MNNGKIIRNISKEFNNPLEATGHFGTFSSNNINNENQYFINPNLNNQGIRTKYDKQFSETNPKRSDHNNTMSLNNLIINSDIDNTNLSFENIKFLPNYYLDLEEALKKSNNNVYELQKTVKEKINEEKTLKSIIENLKVENNKLLKINEELTNKNNKYENSIKKYQNVKGILETEINNLGEDIQDGVKTLQKQLKKIQEENYKLISLNKKISEEKNNLITLNKKLSEENYKFINEIKKLKTDIKNHLYEKINILKINNINKEQKIVNDKLNNIINYNKIKIKSLSKENDNLKNIEKDYKYLSNNYKKICDDNINYKEKMRKKENLEKNLDELKEKFDKEKFEYICQINIWKKNFFSIAKYRLLNYSLDYDRNIIDVMKIEEKYINNAPTQIKKLADKILDYFKELIDQEKENSKISNKNEIVDYKEKINILNDKLNQEKKIRRKIYYKYLELRNNMGIMCRIRSFPKNDKNEVLIDKNSQIDTFIIDKNSLIVKNNKVNNNLKKFEFDYIFPENSSQQDIYEEIFPFVHSLFKGNNVIIISFGQKKSGKTFTLLGDNNNIGIIGRALQELFYILNNSDKDKYTNYNISFNIFNILKDGIYNLLEENTPKMTTKENDNGELLIEDLISVKIKSYEEFDNLYKLAKKFKNDSKNINNNNNDNSHLIFSFNINITEKEGNSFKTTLTLIDLGNEIENEKEVEINNNKINDKNEKEAKINEENIDIIEDKKISLSNYFYTFLTFLGKQNIKEYKDWNKNVLVHYLKNLIFNKDYKMLLLLNLNPDINELEETLKTLKFSEGIFSEINNWPHK